MLKKLLPFLQKLKELKLPKLPNPRDLLSKLKKKEPESVPSLLPEDVSNSPEQYSDLNLIVNTGGNPLANIKFSRVLAILQVVTILILTTFIVLFFINQGLSTRLEKEKKETDRLYNDIRNYDVAMEKSRSLNRRIEFYKKTLRERPSLSDKTALISSVSNDSVDIIKVAVDDSTFYINAKGSNALMFAQILETYKSSKRIGEIKLKSARLVKDRVTKQQGFAIELEGNFK